jgi:uncharacterized repeat protein (TIGR03803 family)
MSKRRLAFATLAAAITLVILSALSQHASASGAQPATAAEKVLYQFGYGFAGTTPQGAVAFDTAGNLYSSVIDGGAPKCGTIFELTASSAYSAFTAIHVFECAPDDGATPRGNLIFDNAGNLYSVTYNGGSSDNGTVLELTPGSDGWTESVLYSFSAGEDGAHPEPSLIMDKSGNLYGTTASGGNTGCDGAGCGTVFELEYSPTGWTEKVLYSFTGRADGADPKGIAFNSQGRIYGVTYGGKDTYGTIFELTPGASQWFQKVLYTFTDEIDGAHPFGGIVLDAAGNIYGTTSGFYTFSSGTVFELKRAGSSWELNTLYTFGGTPEGANPTGTLTIAKGNLYGTTYNGGTYSAGTVFELSPSVSGWTETILHSFPYGALYDGMNPQAGVLVDHVGNLFGAASSGAYGDGAVYEIKP